MKGGYDVRVGHARAFCPISQIDTVRDTKPEDHLGRVYAFRIIEYKEGGRNLVVSRRALLEEEQRTRAVEVRRSIVAGAVLNGRVTSVREFGAFVDLGAGVQGLIHVSEMGWSRISDASEFLKPGDEVVVKVLRVDGERQRIALGLKQLTAIPGQRWRRRRRPWRWSLVESLISRWYVVVADQSSSLVTWWVDWSAELVAAS